MFSKLLLPVARVLSSIACLVFFGMSYAIAASGEIPDGVGKPSGFVHVMTFGSKGNGEGQFNSIADFGLTADGKHLLVTDAVNATVQIFDKVTGKFMGMFGGKGDQPGNLVKPEGISVTPNGRIFVADFETGLVKIYDPNYQHIKTFSKYGSAPGENMKSEFTCIHNGKYYMAEAGNHRVSVWDLQGRFVFTYGGPGMENGQMKTPQACKVNSRGESFVSDLGNNRVQVFDVDGKFLRSWGTSGSGPGAFQRPAGLSIDQHDNVYVTETMNNRIQVFDRMGKLITSFGKSGDGIGEFGNLHGCLADKDTGWLYVADTGNHRIQVFKPTGTTLQRLAKQP